MNYLKLFEEFSNDFYEYSFVKNPAYIDNTHFEYHFKDEFGNIFKAEFERKSPTSDEVEFRYLVKDNNYDDSFLFGKNSGGWSYDIVKTNIFKLMRTIFKEIIPEFCKSNEWCNTIKIIGLGKKVEKDAITQRTKLYTWTLRDYPIDGWEVDRYVNEIYLERK